MRLLQEVGTEILTGHPGKLYILTGDEYGIKAAYIQALREHYHEIVEMQRVSDIITLMSTKHLIPLTPCVYVVRYDEEFIASLSEETARRLTSLKIVGTLVCIYSDSKHAAKLEKFLPAVTTSVDKVAPQFVSKYLRKDFPDIPATLIDAVVKLTPDYSQARLCCAPLSYLNTQELYSLTESSIVNLFGITTELSDVQFKRAFAARSFSSCLSLVDKDAAQVDLYLYAMLSTLVELEKTHVSKYANSFIREYTNRWTSNDIYNMFEHVFHELAQLRSGYGSPYFSVVYLLSLTQFQRVPEWEAN